LKGLRSCWGPSERILFKESLERCCNLSIVLDELVIIPCEAQKSTQAFEILRVGPILHGFDLFRVHPDAILAHEMTQVFYFGCTKSTFGLFQEKLVLSE
jgi:hypothetical protein